MNCKQVRTQLNTYLDREMTGRETLAIREHLDRCPGCRAEANDLARLKSLLGSMPDPEPAPDFEARLLLAVRCDRSAVPELPRWRPVLAFVGVAGLSMGATFILLSSWKPASTETAVDRHEPGVAFEVDRDQAYGVGDAAMGVPVFAVEHASR